MNGTSNHTVKLTAPINECHNNGCFYHDDQHTHQALLPTPKIMNTVLENIGNTPCIRLHTIPKNEGIQCEIIAKCEFYNAGGSVKDRIGRRMIEDAERSGRIKPGDTLIEPTSGNTGIGLALTAAIKGYRCIITLPEKMSSEKVDVLKALGAEIIRTPTEAAFDSPDSHIGVAKRLNKEIPNSHILDQYNNLSNPLAHYDTTAEELLYQCDNKVDCVVIAAGTGGTITGIAQKLKERLPNLRVVGVDPIGSILAQPESLNGPISSYKVEGIGYDFIPRVLERNLVDEWIKTNDLDSFTMARRLIKEEGLLVGGSSGSAMFAALQVARKMKAGQRLVVLFADSIRNYMSKHLSENWMIANQFMDQLPTALQSRYDNEWWSSHTVAELRLNTPFTITPGISCSQCIEIFNEQGFDQLPVVSDNNEVLGMVTLGNLTSQLLSGRISADDSITKAIYKQFKAVSISTKLSELSLLFDNDHFALVVTTQRCYVNKDTVSEKSLIFGIVTRIDLLNYIIANKSKYTSSNTEPNKV